MMWRLAGLSLVSALSLAGWSCPPICPECTSWSNFFLTERHPELGIVTKHCVQATCDLLPWCFEAIVSTGRRLIPWTTFFVNERDLDILTSPDVDAYVRGGVATICVRLGYEQVIPIPGIGKQAGEVALIRLPVAGLRGKACMGKCPCKDVGFPPLVTTNIRPTNEPRRPLISISAFQHLTSMAILCALGIMLDTGMYMRPRIQHGVKGHTLACLVFSRNASMSLPTIHLRNAIPSRI